MMQDDDGGLVAAIARALCCLGPECGKRSMAGTCCADEYEGDASAVLAAIEREGYEILPRLTKTDRDASWGLD